MGAKYRNHYDAINWVKKTHDTSGVSRYSAEYFFNDLDNENDYYLEVRQSGENTFIKKDKVDEKDTSKKEKFKNKHK